MDELANRSTCERAADRFDVLLEAARQRAEVVATSLAQHYCADDQVTPRLLGERVPRLDRRQTLVRPVPE